MWGLEEIQAMNTATGIVEERYPGHVQDVKIPERRIYVFRDYGNEMQSLVAVYNWGTGKWEDGKGDR